MAIFHSYVNLPKGSLSPGFGWQSQEVLSFQPDDQAVFARFMNGDCERSGSNGWSFLVGIRFGFVWKWDPPKMCIFFGKEAEKAMDFGASYCSEFVPSQNRNNGHRILRGTMSFSYPNGSRSAHLRHFTPAGLGRCRLSARQEATLQYWAVSRGIGGAEPKLERDGSKGQTGLD